MKIGKLISLAAALGAAFLLLPPVQTQFYTAGIRWLYVLLVSYLVAVALTPLIRHAEGGPALRLEGGARDPLVAAYLAALARTAEYVNGVR